MMKLHSEKDSFRVLIDLVSEKTGYRPDILEKDYYVVLLLQELSQMQQQGLPAYFKGGTALYKAIKATNRFSEDIDLSVDITDCNRTQGDKRLEKASKKYTVLNRDVSAGKNNRSEIIAVYTYDPAVPYDANDTLQRFGKVKIEATSFTISEPIFDLQISTLLYDNASTEQKQILETQYDVKPFFIKTITIERIFVDKLFAAEAYVRNSNEGNKAFEAAKHIYDLAVISNHSNIISLMESNDPLKRLLDIRTTEEKKRLDGIPGVAPSEFVFFRLAGSDQNVKNAYGIMQKQYVLDVSKTIPFENAIETLKRIENTLWTNDTWYQYQIIN